MKRIIHLLLPAMLLIACSHPKENKVNVKQADVDIAVGIGKIGPRGDISNLSSAVSGIVTKVYVKTGDRVKAGDILLSIDQTDASLALNEIGSRIATQQVAIQAAKLSRDQALAQLKEKARKLADAKELLAVGAVTGESVHNLQNEFDTEKLNADRQKNDILRQESQLKELIAQQKAKAVDYQRTALRSPMDGVVLDMMPREGEALNGYAMYARLAPNTPLVVKAEMDEMYADRLATGQACDIRKAGETKIVATGTISTISPDLKNKSLFSDNGQDPQDRRVRVIEVQLSSDTKLLIDTKVECVVHLK